MKYLIVATRIALTAFLLFQVYQETGIFTALSIGLIGIAVELHTQHLTVNNKSLESLLKIIKTK